jgi:lipopolysaccharide export system protein LptA
MKISPYVFPVMVAVLSMIAVPHVQAQPQTQSGTPLEITADGSLEWHRNENFFLAQNNAMAKQGDMSIAAETLTARYEDEESGAQNFNIQEILAQKDVIIQSKETSAFGQQATYNLQNAYAELTGDNLRLVSPDQTVTAQEKFEYWVSEGRLVARGDATVLRKNAKGELNTLKADTLTAYLQKDKNGKQSLERLEASGHVTIKTPTETLSGDKATYTSATNIAEITQRVKIMRGSNILEGSRADVDLNTGISRIFGDSKSGSRVRGVFYPGSEKSVP